MKNAACDALVSVIVPVYKVEKYIRKCLDSLAAQTYKNLEVIMIDDGSPDNCGAICDEYAQKYPFIKVIHQENRGYGGARNVGVAASKGKYITFVDSDDFVEPNYVEYLVNLLTDHDADIAIGGSRYAYEGVPVEPVKNNESTVTEMDVEETLRRMNYTKGFGATVWAKIYKREIIVKYPIPEGVYYEDLANLYKYICESQKIVYGNQVIHYWLQRDGSQTRRPFDEHQMDGLQAAENQLAYMRDNHPSVVLAAKARYMCKVVEVMSTVIHTPNGRPIYKRLKSKMNYYNEVMQDPNVRKTQKMRMLSMKIGYLPAQLVFRAHELLKRIKFAL